MRHAPRLPILLLALAIGGLTVAACGSASSSRRSGVTGTRIVVTKLPLSAQEMSVYEIVRRYKSSWLRGRGETSIYLQREVSVFLSTNSTKYGGPESLRRIRGQNVSAIEYLSSQEAQFKFGLNNPRGVIYVIMKGGE